ncbi:acyltransferase [Phragmitibacter flavus]|uniref:Acyltransferase n=1 Tax=Phragmitibacter flavus TaxID=2576071 RepID=A0A5R8K905_9BACT|nr:acyltransferase [Phragmitibacter flavus]TLD68425.1 acyltransferase [Phragmitibacter flavus]
MNETPTKKAPLEFPVLDLFRGITTIWVLIAHITFICGTPIYFISAGWLAVEIFIALSGFLMYLLLLDERASKPGAIKAYYVRRFFRVAPSFYLALILYICFREFYVTNLGEIESLLGSDYKIPGVNLEIGPWSVVLNFLFLNGFIPWENIKIVAPSWTLCLEMQYYLLAPLLIPILRNKPLVGLGIYFVVNLVANKLFGVFGESGLLFDYFYPSFLPNRLFLFGIGAMLCRAVLDNTSQNRMLLALSLLGGLYLFTWRSAMVCTAFAIVVMLTTHHHGYFSRGVKWLADTRAVRLLADWTYGIYLYQMFGMAMAAWVMTRYLPKDLSFPVMLTVFVVLLSVFTVIITVVVFNFVEKPARSLGRVVSKRITEKAKRKAAGEDLGEGTTISRPLAEP